MKHHKLLGMLLIAISFSSYGQFTAGLKGTLITSIKSPRFFAKVNGYEVFESNSGDGKGSAWGPFVRYDFPRWYAQIEASKGQYSPPGLTASSPTYSSGTYMRFKRQDARLIIGYKPLPWLRVNAGVVGVRNRYQYPLSNDSYIKYLQEQILQYPDRIDSYKDNLEVARILAAVQTSYQLSLTEGQVGVGADVGGFTFDLTYNRSLSPIVDGIYYQGKPYTIGQHYSFWSISAGYRLLPLKTFLLQPRKNRRTYERIKKTIPYYRNEVSAGLGITSDDFGGAWIYENRYTRYVHRRFGLTAIAGLVRSFEDYSQFLPQAQVGYQLSTLIRGLPLYTRRHHLGLSAGRVFTFVSGFKPSYGSGYNRNGQLYLQTINVTSNNRFEKQGRGVQFQVDYEFLPTDHLAAGTWFRFQKSEVLRYAAMGFQIGYRF
ncbi:hypothetical protein [Larkinella rosea]|uniref:Outer membrane protein beta-barrel domain-containing protein n=1 Tax=Larkinella rosea TaxID=2025312 RepID=A0A3P1BCV9_9BACT|nr:hypothetical protein [Larkinella rosea]RRA98874.1 hypothetical protein EHT25_28210 [Larkinella rosea]